METLGDKSAKTQILLAGDFNFPLINWPDQTNCQTPLLDLMETFNLEQKCNQPTFITDHSSSKIDLVFQNCSLIKHFYTKTWTGDHEAIISEIGFSTNPHTNLAPPKKLYGNAPWRLINQDFAAHLDSIKVNFMHMYVDDMWKTLKKEILALVDKHVPKLDTRQQVSNASTKHVSTKSKALVKKGKTR